MCLYKKVIIILSSFLIRFNYRLRQLYERLNNKTVYYQFSKHLKNIDSIINIIFQEEPLKMFIFFQTLFTFHRLQLQKLKKKKFNNSLNQGKNNKDTKQSRKIGSTVTVLNNNIELYKCWKKQGRNNYSIMDIDYSLQQIYYFTRQRTQNIERMYQNLCERNKQINSGLKKYKLQYKSHKKSRNRQNSIIVKDIAAAKNRKQLSNVMCSLGNKQHIFRIRTEDKKNHGSKIIKQNNQYNKQRKKQLKPNTIYIDFLNLKTTCY